MQKIIWEHDNLRLLDSVKKQELNLFENVVEAGSTIVVGLSSLPGFPANNQVKMVFEMKTDYWH